MNQEQICFNALTGLNCYPCVCLGAVMWYVFQCPHGLELLLAKAIVSEFYVGVSMPSRAWIVTRIVCSGWESDRGFNALTGLNCYGKNAQYFKFFMILLCIPAIYRYILAHLPIFFNQLSKFLRCESPSTFLGTYLSHHSFIIFLVTNTNTLLSGLYLISTEQCFALNIVASTICVNALSGLYLISTEKTFYNEMYHEFRVNALSGLYLISTVPLQKPRFYAVSRACFCRYLSEYSDNSRFSCMLTFWTYLMRCTYPWHWI